LQHRAHFVPSLFNRAPMFRDDSVDRTLYGQYIVGENFVKRIQPMAWRVTVR
jgi:hypothetical protein